MKNAIKSFLFRLRFNLSASNNFIFLGYYKYFYRPKKDTLEGLLSDYSKNIGPSFNVIQVGANDGITHDPIHKFIKRDKWSGVLLEPQYYVFEKFLSKIYRKHPNITVLNAAMGYKNGTSSIYKIGFSTSRWATGLTTFDRKTLEKAFESGHVARKCAKEGIEIPSDTSIHIVEEPVQIVSAEHLISEYNLDKIDLLMIDTEGFDFEIIKMIDINANEPGMIIFEHSHLSEGDYQTCIAHLQENNYTVKKDGANTIAIKDNLNQYPAYFGD
ncbi:MAG: FkbM family methyltransferase [Crocinitomicaceae bacterium]|nr:FkbM family methyltransferase [Crocinitomicaceae bacterium]